MLHTLARLTRDVLSLILLLTALGAGLSAQAGPAGKWELDIDSPQGIMKVGLVLTVDGDAVKGSISSEMGEATFTGAVTGADVKFTFDMAGPQGPMSVTTKATVTGDEIKGEMDYGMGVAPFSGKRVQP